MRRRRKSEERQVGWPAAVAAARGAGALPRRGADRLAGSGQSRVDRAGGGHDHLPRRQRHPRRHRHAGRGAGPRLGAAGSGARLRRRRPGMRAGSPSGRARSGSISKRRRGRDITPRTIWSALAGGKRVMHVEYVPSPDYAVRQIRLRPEEYRRLVGRDPRRLRARCATAGRSGSIIRATAAATRSIAATGKASAVRTCNSWVAELAAARRREDEPVAALRAGARLAVRGRALLSSCFFVAAASISALVMPMTRPLSPLAKLDDRDRSTRTLPVLTTTPFELTDSTLPTCRRSGRAPKPPP